MKVITKANASPKLAIEEDQILTLMVRQGYTPNSG